MKRWLRKLFRWTLVITSLFLLLFAFDLLAGLGPLGLRVAFAGIAAVGATFLLADFCAAWLTRLDLLGLAHLLEKPFPKLAERLVTLVQLNQEPGPSSFVPLLREETRERLTGVEPAAACPLTAEGKLWGGTVFVLAAVFIPLAFVPAFGNFVHRFATAWTTPLIPFQIEIIRGNGYVLRGENHPIEVQILQINANVQIPGECVLLCESHDGEISTFTVLASDDGRLLHEFKDVREPMRFKVRAGDVVSKSFDVGIVDAPVLTSRPAVVVASPGYLAKPEPETFLLGDGGEKPDLVSFSRFRLQIALDRSPKRASLRIARTADTDRRTTAEISLSPGIKITSPDVLAHLAGEFTAELILEVEHGLVSRLPIGAWTVRDDGPPRFYQPVRLHGGSLLSSQQEYRIGLEPALQLETEVRDDDGLSAVLVEWQVNGTRRPPAKWLNGDGATRLPVDDWLTLPTGLKEGDRVSFRLHAVDNRRVKKGEFSLAGGVNVPEKDLLPQVAIMPAPGDSEEAWFTFRVHAATDFVKEQAARQEAEVRDIIGKIKQKLQVESTQIEQLQRSIHGQPVLTPAQNKQAENLQTFNREIRDDLERAARHFSDSKDLRPLADRLLDIVETEMKKSADALERFSAKDRSLAETEPELKTAQEAIAEARKKLDGLLDLNKLLAQDRLDQAQIAKMAKRQQELADRFAKLLAQKTISDADRAKEIEAIRREQKRLAEEMTRLEKESKLVQDSLASLEQKRLDNLAKSAKDLAMEQRAGQGISPEQLSGAMKEQLAKLAERQAALSQRMKPFAEKNQGPDVKPADAAAAALKKPEIEAAIEQQKEVEKRLSHWSDKLVGEEQIAPLREQILLLAKRQKEIRTELAALAEVPAEKKNALSQRQQGLPGAIAKLPIPVKNEWLQPGQKRAEQAAQKAGEQLNSKDAKSSLPAMEDAQRELEALAALLASTLTPKRADVKNPDVQKKLEQVETFARDQETIRKETEKILGDAAKASAGSGPHPLKEKADKLASDLLELAQQGGSPEAKAMAKESADAIDQAKKSMDASQAMKAKGNAEDAKKMDKEAEQKLDLAVKQLAKLSQEQAMKNMPSDDAVKTGQSLQDSADQMRKAEATLPTQPKDAQSAMNAAAKSLAQAVKQSQKQMTGKTPPGGMRPSAKSELRPGGLPGGLPKDAIFEMMAKGKSWGELPGELKTQMLQDYRNRFGEDYAETIRQYFERLAETPPRDRRKND